MSIEVNNPDNPNFNYTIELRCRYKVREMSMIDARAIRTFMSIIRGYIGFKTKLGYYISSPDKDGTIVIPIDVLDNGDVTSYKDIMRKKITDLKRYLEKEIDYDSFMKEHKVALSMLSLYKFDFKRMLYIASKHLKNTIDINMKPLTFEKSSIDVVRYGEDEVLNIYCPYLDQSIISVDFSVPYGEMSFMYNALHVYEHIMCSPWVDMQTKNGTDGLINMNGLTSGLGNCFVYCILNTKNAFESYFNEMAKWLYASRDDKFWSEHSEHINMEITRTISETKTVPYHLTFARSPGCAYNMDYNENIFSYWSNKPFNITIIHPYKINMEDLEISKLYEKHQPRHIDMPTKPKLKWFPYSIANMSGEMNVVTKKMKPEDIGKIVTNYYTKEEIIDGNISLDVIKRDVTLKGFLQGKILEFINMFAISTIRRYIPKSLNAKIIVSILTQTQNLENLFEYTGDIDFEAEKRMEEFPELKSVHHMK